MLMIVVAIAVAGILYLCHKLPYHFRVVEPGRLYRSGALTPPGLLWCHRRYRFKTIISLISDKEIQMFRSARFEKKFCQKQGIAWVQIPLRHIPNPAQIRQFLSICDDPQCYPILIHCQQGVVRTAAMVAVYLNSTHKLPGRFMLEHLPTFGHSLARRKNMKDFILFGLPTGKDIT